jgi:CO/xanthine dehydrogenase Mo-binding subunit
MTWMAAGAVQAACRAALEERERAGDGAVDVERVYRHPRTFPLDPETGQIVEGPGHALNPVAVEGQIEGGIAQGLGLAVMEELQTRDGVIANASFTDYLIPTFLDMPTVVSELVEEPHPDSPYGVKGVGEPPAVVSTAAIASALRDATGRELPRVPVTPDALVGL